MLWNILDSIRAICFLWIFYETCGPDFFYQEEGKEDYIFWCVISLCYYFCRELFYSNFLSLAQLVLVNYIYLAIVHLNNIINKIVLIVKIRIINSLQMSIHLCIPVFNFLFRHYKVVSDSWFLLHESILFLSYSLYLCFLCY